MSYCTNCGRSIPDHMTACPYCGGMSGSSFSGYDTTPGIGPYDSGQGYGSYGGYPGSGGYGGYQGSGSYGQPGYQPTYGKKNNNYASHHTGNQEDLLRTIMTLGIVAICLNTVTVFLAPVGAVIGIICLVQAKKYTNIYGPLPSKMQAVYLACLFSIVFGAIIFLFGIVFMINCAGCMMSGCGISDTGYYY